MKRVLAIFLALSFSCIGEMFFVGPVNAQLAPPTVPRGLRTLTMLSSRPLSFTENQGQWNEKTLFKAETSGATFYFCRDEVAYLFIRDTNELADDLMQQGRDLPGIPDGFETPRYKQEGLFVKARFIGANPTAVISGEERLAHNTNYFYGNEPSKWRANVPNYSSITYNDIYPGIDLKYHGDGQAMKYDFIVGPGADISRIRIAYKGVENLSVSQNGDLEATTSFGPVYEKAPHAFQIIAGKEIPIECEYGIDSEGAFSFRFPKGHNPNYPLVIDPELVYSSYLGGNHEDEAYGVALDDDGNIYVTGYTQSLNFPLTDPYDSDLNDGQVFYRKDAFVTKLDPTGHEAIYSSYLGGNEDDAGMAVTLDEDHHPYFTGTTNSINFPTFAALDSIHGGFSDVFVTKLSENGDSLIFSTFVGGNLWNDRGRAIALDSENNIYVTGSTDDPDFPMVNAYDDHYEYYLEDAFVFMLNPSGTSLLFSTYLGGGEGTINEDLGTGITVGSDGSIYVAGYTTCWDFPVINAYDSIFSGSRNAFIAKFSPWGDSLVFSTFFGSYETRALAIDCDVYNNIIIVGLAGSIPIVNAFQPVQGGDNDAFVAKFSPDGQNLLFSTYLGGEGYDCARGVACDNAGNVYITGYSGSADFPLVDPYQVSYHGGGEAFLTKLSSSGRTCIYSTFIGGSGQDEPFAVAVNNVGKAAIAGRTRSFDFPLNNAYDSICIGSWEAFVAKFGPSLIPPCSYIAGDANGDSNVNAEDVVYSVNYLKGLVPMSPLICECTGLGYLRGISSDANGNCVYNGIDVTYSVNHLKGIGPAPMGCPSCPPGN